MMPDAATMSERPIHDRPEQVKGFVYSSWDFAVCAPYGFGGSGVYTLSFFPFFPFLFYFLAKPQKKRNPRIARKEEIKKEQHSSLKFHESDPSRRTTVLKSAERGKPSWCSYGAPPGPADDWLFARRHVPNPAERWDC